MSIIDIGMTKDDPDSVCYKVQVAALIDIQLILAIFATSLSNFLHTHLRTYYSACLEHILRRMMQGEVLNSR